MNDLNSLLDQSSYLRLISANGSEVERTTSSIGLTAQKKYVPSEYVSCIRINGKPILPPVMTPERKLECLEWKQKALDVEEKLCVKRKEKIIETIKLLKTSSASAPPRPSSVPIDEEYISNAMISPINDNDVSNEKSYFENADEYSSTKCLNTEIIKDSEHETDGADCEGKLDNLASVQIENCSSDIIDINSETDENSQNAQMEELNQCNVTNGHQNEGTQEMTTESRDDSSIKTPIYKRERRGSYTLDEPSPLLLAYMERFGQNFNEDNSMNQTVSKMSHVSQVKAVNLNPEMSSTVEMHPKEKENCLVDYLSQLSQPPESKTLLNTVEKSHDSITDYTVNGDIVTESKTVNGSFSQNKSVEDDDCPGLQEPLDNEVQKYLVENKETERINLRPKTPPDLEASTLTDDPSINNEYLSTKIKKLSSTVQNETEIIQKRILSLEQTRQALTNRTDNQDILQIGIPKQSNVNTEEYDTSKIIQKSPNMISPSMNSIASSLQESMSIRVPSSRGPKEQITKSPSKETAVVFSEIQIGHIKQDNIVQFSSSPTNNLTTITSTSTRKSSRQTMELAVSSLAKSQQDEIQKLMQQQEKERLELKQLFEQQQKRLIQELLYQFNSRSETPSSVSSTTIEVGYPSSAITRSQVSKTSNSDTSTLEASIRSLNVQNTSRRKQQKAKIEQEEGYNNGSSNISQVKIPHNNDNILLLSSPQTHRSTSPVIPALPMYLRPESRILPSNFHVPSEVFTDARLHKGFCKISALVKGHLIRRLMKTDRVLRVIGSMRDTMTIALQLHQEVKESKRTLNTNPVNISTPKKVSIQDIELHRRLLQQLLKDSQEFHNIFFKLTTSQKLNVIKLDSEKKEGRSRIAMDSPKDGKNHPLSPGGNSKRVTTATKARIEQKQLIQQMLINSKNNISNTERSANRAILSAPRLTYSLKREVTKTRTPERPKSSTPRAARPKIGHGKSLGVQRSKSRHTSHSSILSRPSTATIYGTSPRPKSTRFSRRNSSTAALNPSTANRTNGIIGNTKPIVIRANRRKKRARSAVGSLSLYSNPSKVVVHNKPWK